MEIDNEKLKKYLSTKNCRGCYSHCFLDNPYCNRSTIYIKEETEKFKNRNNK